MAKKKKEKKIKELSYEEKIAKSLGSANSYAVATDNFDPTLLNPIPRKDPRDHWNITEDLFVGSDIWHCHEATFITDNGIPVAGTLKIVYPSNSTDMIESKSMKVYLNSFDMCRMGATIESAIENYERQIKTDLEKALDTSVAVGFFESGEHEQGQNSFKEYRDLSLLVEANQSELEITDFKGERSHLVFIEEKGVSKEYKIFTNVLRSRCRHTKQKDTGTAFIHIKTKECSLDTLSLFKEIVSLREVDEFHELCAEKLFKSIVDTGYVEECMVTLMYSRRGSLDINPVRASNYQMIPRQLLSSSCYTEKTQGQ